MAKPDRADIDRAYARLFNSADGAMVLADLRAMTVDAVQGPDIADAHLRVHQGRCLLWHHINQAAKRGTNG